jgi:hypothetical protein
MTAADTPDPRPVSPPSELTAFSPDQIKRWREEVAKRPRGYADWPDDDVLVLVGRFLATLAAAPAAGLRQAPQTPSEWVMEGMPTCRHHPDGCYNAAPVVPAGLDGHEVIVKRTPHTAEPCYGQCHRAVQAAVGDFALDRLRADPR